MVVPFVGSTADGASCCRYEASKRPFTFSQPTGPAPTSTGTKSGFDEKIFVIFPSLPSTLSVILTKDVFVSATVLTVLTFKCSCLFTN